MHSATRRGGVVSAALARAEGWLLEPAAPRVEADRPDPLRRRAVVAVFGLAPSCGATVVARGLAAELGRRDDGAAAVWSPVAVGATPLSFPAAARLARTLAEVPGARTRATGRVCLVECPDQLAVVDAARHLSPLVLDAGHASVGGAPAALADHVVLVARPGVEPALAPAVAAGVARVGPRPIVVLNRSVRTGAWERHAVLALPESRMGAGLALAGREPPGPLGRAIADLADLCGATR